MYIEEQISELKNAILELKKTIINSGRNETQYIEKIIVKVKENNNDELLTTAEIAKLLKCNKNYIGNLFKSGLLPYMQFGSRKVRRKTFELFLQKYEGWDLSDPYYPKKLS